MKRTILTLFLLSLTSIVIGPAHSKTCTKGKPCGNTCISVNYVCHIGTYSTDPTPTTTPTTSSTTTAPPATTTTTTTSTSTTTTTSSTTTTTLGSGAGGATVNVLSGWNLIGNSNDATLTVATVFGKSAKVQTVWQWNSATSTWAFFTPILADGGQSYAASKGYSYLQTIGGGQGFWVNALSAFSIQLPPGAAVAASSFQPGQVRALSSGWSLVSIGETKTPGGFHNGLSSTPPATGVAEYLTTLWAWDAGQSAWYFWAPSLHNAGTLHSYIQSKGYLDFAGGNKTLGPGMGFWVNKP